MRVILLVALVASVAVSVPAALAADAFDHTYSTFAPVLSKHVAKNRVNYSALALDQETLAAFVESIGDVKEKEYRTFTRDQQRAFWINVYNALVLQIVIDSYPIKPDADRKYSKYPDNSPMSIEGAWHEKTFDSPLGDVTLSRIENNILPDLGHPLVVFGLCNGTKGAPALAEVPYRAETLDKQLEERTRLFIRDEQNVAADDDGAALTLSRFLRQHGKRLIPRFYEHNGLFKKRDKMEIALMNLIIKFGEPNSKAVAAVKKNMFTIQWKEPNWSLNDLL